MRGILNLSQTACHLNSALVIVGYALVPLREALIVLCDDDDDNTLIYDDLADDGDESATNTSPRPKKLTRLLGRFFKEWTALRQPEHQQQHDGPSPIDPSSLYDALREAGTGLESEDLGDCVTGVMKLLEWLRTEEPAIPRRLWETTLDGGKIHSILTAVMVATDNPNDDETTTTKNKSTMIQQTRTKETKVRSMPCPFPVPINNTTCAASFTEAIRATLLPKTVVGYKWGGNYEETTRRHPVDEESNDTRHQHASNSNHQTEKETRTALGDDVGNSDECDWTTTKQLVVDNLPFIWMFELQRGSDQGRDQAVDDSSMKKQRRMTIPASIHPQDLFELNNTSTSSSCSDVSISTYELVGGILHVREDADDDDEDDGCCHNEERIDGHYVSLVRSPLQDQNDDKRWVLVDDADTKLVSTDRAMELFSGSETSNSGASNGNKISSNGGHQQWMHAVLVVYRRADLADITDVLLDDLRVATKRNGKVSTAATTAAASAAEDWRQQDPHQIVGRRLKVRWGKKPKYKYYPGIVTSYNPETRKHQVTYDDGDVREYDLSKKTIQMIED